MEWVHGVPGGAPFGILNKIPGGVGGTGGVDGHFYRFSDKARWIWNQPNANRSAPANVPVHFKYIYHNNTGSEISKLGFIILLIMKEKFMSMENKL